MAELGGWKLYEMAELGGWKLYEGRVWGAGFCTEWVDVAYMELVGWGGAGTMISSFERRSGSEAMREVQLAARRALIFPVERFSASASETDC